MKKLTSIFVLIFLIISKFCYAENLTIFYKIDEELSEVVVTKNKKEADYYRKISKTLGAGKYLIQDFYISGKKWTDPYISTNNDYAFFYNESGGDDYFPREGKRTIWYESGKKLADTYYKNNKKDGKWLTYDEQDGWITRIENFKNGKTEGEQLQFDAPNHIVEAIPYMNGKIHGTYYSKYNETNNLKHKWIYSNDHLNGLAEYWYENGQKEKEENYKKDQLNGSVIHWNRNGEKTLDCTYKNDKKVKCTVDKE